MTVTSNSIDATLHTRTNTCWYPGRVYRTVRHLTAQQVWWQVVNRVRSRLENPARHSHHRPTSMQWRLGEPVEKPEIWVPVPLQSFSDLTQYRFRFLNRVVQLSQKPIWAASGLPRLWQYNLHYFDWLWSCVNHGDTGWELARQLTRDWIETHPPGRTATGWEPYPTSLRITNWCLLFGGEWRSQLARDDVFREQLSASLCHQSSWLSKHIEYHLMANHVLENAVALAMIGKYFAGEQASRLSALGNSLARAQLQEQILADGMHFERSPMYHARCCWLVAVLANCGSVETRAVARELLPQMLRAMSHMLHPDDEIALLNDSAIGIYAVPRSPDPVVGAFALPEAGYYGFRTREGDFVICDCAPVGPDYQPGHAHADTFSFEWSVAGARFVTDTGTLEYDTGLARAYDRSTPAHNTVSIAGLDSSEVWGAFRVGARCIPGVDCWETTADGFRLMAVHHGYGCWAHRREYEFNPMQLTLTDSLMGWGDTTAAAYLHFAPGVDVQLGDGSAQCSWGLNKARVTFSGGDCDLELLSTRYSPEFGKAIVRHTLVCRKRIVGNTSWKTHIRILAKEAH